MCVCVLFVSRSSPIAIEVSLECYKRHAWVDSEWRGCYPHVWRFWSRSYTVGQKFVYFTCSCKYVGFIFEVNVSKHVSYSMHIQGRCPRFSGTLHPEKGHGLLSDTALSTRVRRTVFLPSHGPNETEHIRRYLVLVII